MSLLKFDSNNKPYADLGNGFKIRLEEEPVVDEKYLQKAKIELREDPEVVNEALFELRELIKAEKNFTFPHEGDFFHICFLRPCKYYPKSAFERMQKFYKFKIKHKNIHENLTPLALRTVFEDDLVKYFPLRDKNGCRIIYIHTGKLWKPSKIPLNDMFRTIQLSLQAAMLEPMSQINGVSVILDVEGLSLGQIVHFTPFFAAMLLEWLQECVPLRIKGVYITNNSYIFNIAFKIFKPFIHAKLRQRIHFVGKDWDMLGNFLGKEFLKSSLGGDLPCDDVDGNILNDLMQELSEKLKAWDKGGYTAQK
ncbi:hypothetical protein ACKWTF_013973 [Chironomus riparius]